MGLIDAVLQPLDDLTQNLVCTTYVWREDKFAEAVSGNDWSQDGFNKEHEKEFTSLCADVFEEFKTSKISDQELKEKSLRRRREATGFEDEEEFKPEVEEEEFNPDDDA